MLNEVTLIDHVSTQKGFAFKSAWFTDFGRPIVKVSNFSNDSVNWTELIFVPEDIALQYARYELRTGDVLIQTVGSWPNNPLSVVGKTVRVPKQVNGALLNQNAVKLVPRSTLDGSFLFYLLRDKKFAAYIVGTAQGAANQAAITLESIRAFTFALPPIKRQRRIASILSAYDDLIENNTRRIAILEEMARRLFEEWFVRFRFPGHEGVPLVESELGLVPQGWTVKQLNEVAIITMGLSPKGDTYNEEAQGMPLINGPVEFGEKFAKRVKWTTAPTKTCRDGDLIICVRGSTTGKYVKSDGVYCLGRGVCALSSSYQCFVDQLFLHQLPILLNQTGGSTFPSWTGPQLKSHPVLIPPINLLMRFEAHVESMSAAVLTYSRKNANLRTTRDLLLPKLISGELDVSTLPEPLAKTV